MTGSAADRRCPHCADAPLRLVKGTGTGATYECESCRCLFTGRDMRLVEPGPSCPLGLVVQHFSRKEHEE